VTDDRVLVLMPTPKDGERTRQVLAAAGLDAVVCESVDDLCREIPLGAGAALLTEEEAAAGCLQEALRGQPHWSDLPLVVLAREGADGRGLRESMNVTLVERPVKVRPLVSVVRAALRSRRHQYAVRDHLETIRRERERYRVTLSSIGDAVIATDAGGRVSFMNGVAEALTGWPQAEATGRPLPDAFRIVHERTREPADNPALRALREGAVVGLANHTVLIARDGTERPIDDSAAPMREGGEQVGAVLVFRDVTERKRAEENLARLAAIVESSDDAIVSKSLDGTIRSWNAGAERLFGYTAEEAIGRPITLVIPPERHEEEPRILERLGRGERVDHFETVRLTKDGRRIDVSLTISPILDSDGRVIGASKVARDVTERKRAEDALREADRKKDEFIALLAHELRNPLAPLRNGLQVIRMSGDRAARERSQRMMERQLSHMVRMIDDLLDVSRINRNKMELRRARVALADAVSSAVETAGPAVEEGGHELTVSLPGAPVYLDADLTRLSQVFGNLLTNSAKYTPRGGRIWLSAERRGGEVVVSVRDTGIGIPERSLPTVFDMFSQVDRAIERATGGLGIGLALVRGLVEMHGGTVAAASEGEGSTFTVTLPVAADRAGPEGHAPEAGKEARAGRRVLVVDDNRDGAESMAEMLRLLGDEVRTAHDGEEAVTEAERFRPGVVLMDVGMPRLNGLDATRRIREQPWGKGITIVALTGWGQEGDRGRSREAGCDGHLVKPVDLSDLEQLLGELQRDKR
jgi:PAS domain S-box-containing protein